MAQPQQKDQQDTIAHGFSYSFSLATFQQAITNNFRHVQELLIGQAKQINEIKVKMSLEKQDRIAEMKKSNRMHSIEGLQSQNSTNIVSPQVGLNPKNADQGQKQKKSEGQLQQAQLQKTQQDPIKPSQQKFPHLKNEVQVIQTKIFELFERVRSLQQKQMFGSRKISTNLREFEFSIMNTNKIIERKQVEHKELSSEIEKLRNDLTQYKLKKESKINKLMQTNSLQQSTLADNDNYEYVAQKLQFLLKHVKQLLLRKTFEEQRESLNLKVDHLRKKINQTVNQAFLHEALKNTELKIYQTVAKHIKAHYFTAQETSNNQLKTDVPTQNQLDQIIQQGDRELNQKVNAHEQEIKKMGQRLQSLASDLELNRKQRLQSEQEWIKQNRSFQDFQAQIETKIAQIDRSTQDLKHTINQKNLQIENQIIDLQQNGEKLNSQLKTYSYSKQDFYASFSALKATPQKSNEKKGQDRIQSNPEMEQDFNAQKKKIAKLIAKIQGLKQDMLVMREDFTRQVDGLKMSLEKKADWDSLKKGLNYFDEKIKEFKILLQSLYESSQGNQNGDSLAVKKGWTCLMCDRDIKNYEGKLGEIKFTSVFPAREASPRIGGYYKQQQSSQQYKQLFLNNPTNYRGKRVGSLKPNQTNQSREELNS